METLSQSTQCESSSNTGRFCTAARISCSLRRSSSRSRLVPPLFIAKALLLWCLALVANTGHEFVALADVIGGDGGEKITIILTPKPTTTTEVTTTTTLLPVTLTSDVNSTGLSPIMNTTIATNATETMTTTVTSKTTTTTRTPTTTTTTTTKTSTTVPPPTLTFYTQGSHDDTSTGNSTNTTDIAIITPTPVGTRVVAVEERSWFVRFRSDAPPSMFTFFQSNSRSLEIRRKRFAFPIASSTFLLAIASSCVIAALSQVS